MTVLVRIPTILRSYTGGAAEVSASAGTLRQVIAGLDAAYPGLGGRILDEGGQLRRFVNAYVGEEDVRFAQGLDTPVASGARVSFIPAVAGGALPDPSQPRPGRAGRGRVACLGGKWRLRARHRVRSIPVAVGRDGVRALGTEPLSPVRDQRVPR